MKDKFTEIAHKVQTTATSVAKQTQDFVQAHATEENVERAKAMAPQAGNAAVEFSKEITQTKIFQDAAKGAAVGALVTVPIPLIGPVAGGIFGGAAGVIMGLKGGSKEEAVRLPPQVTKDLHDQLIKLNSLRQQNLLTDTEFQEQKKKLLKRA